MSALLERIDHAAVDRQSLRHPSSSLRSCDTVIALHKNARTTPPICAELAAR